MDEINGQLKIEEWFIEELTPFFDLLARFDYEDKQN